MPALTWDREDLEYIIWAYRQGVLLEDMVEILGRDKYAISNCAGRLGLTDKANAQKVRYQKGIAKITPELLKEIEHLVGDWGYSARKVIRVLRDEHGVTISKTSIMHAINHRISESAKRAYKAKWTKHSKYKPLAKHKWTKKGPEYIERAIEKYYEQHRDKAARQKASKADSVQ